MKRVIRFFVCCIISFVVVYLSGYGNLMNDISESLAITTLLGAVLVLSILVFLVIEMYLNFKNQISQLSKRIDELENKKDAE